LSQTRELLGNGSQVLLESRNPFFLREVLVSEGFLAPELRGLGNPPDHGPWVLKPFRSGGGFGMRLCHEPAKRRTWEPWLNPQNKPHLDARFYWQRFVPGRPCSAVYVGSPRQTVLLGATRQLL